MLGKFVIAGFEVIIGLIFVWYALVALVYLTLMPAGSEALVIVVFFVCIASFAGIPVIIKKVAKGIKLLIIISVIQIGTTIFALSNPPGAGEGNLHMLLGSSMAVLFILVYYFWQSRKKY